MAAPTETLVYTTVAGRELHMDVYRPAAGGARAKRTAVILLHGGGWQRGSRTTMDVYAELLARAGFVALAGEYRFVGEAPWPAQIEDVQAMVRWARASAGELGIDADKVALQGFSAGGHLALMAGALGDEGTPTGGAAGARPAAVVAFFAPAALQLGPLDPGSSPASRLLGENATHELAAAASPLTRVDADYPPTFLLHGTEDQTVLPAASRRLYDALLAANVSADLHLFHGHAHEFARLPSLLPLLQAEIIAFLERTVVDPERYRQESLTLNPFVANSRPAVADPLPSMG